MNWSLFWIAFSTVMLAETGCFVRTAMLCEQYGQPWIICLGTLAGNALWLVPLIFGGEWLHQHVPVEVARVVAGLVLMALGFLILIGKEL